MSERALQPAVLRLPDAPARFLNTLARRASEGKRRGSWRSIQQPEKYLASRIAKRVK
jgi:hypothetical protein